MKIIHVVESFAGGVLDFLSDLTQGIPEYRHSIIHGIREDTPQSFRGFFPANVEFYPWNSVKREISLFSDMHAFAELVRLLRTIGDCDIVHLHSSKAGVHGRIACRILGMHRRVVYTPHAAPFLRKDISPAVRQLYVAFEKVAAAAAGIVVACSASESEAFRKAGINSTFIFNGIGCEGEVIRKAPGDKMLVGTLGRITPQKHPFLFNEIAFAFANDPFFSFIWIGDGEMKKELSSPNISVTGWLERGKAAERLNDIDLYLSTSRWEGMPLSVLMAMCAGKPLVLSDCVGNRDLVKEGINGFLFVRAADAVTQVQQLFSDNAARDAMGKASRELAINEFSLAKTLEAYRTLYRDISS